MAIEEIEVFRDVPAKPGKKRRPRSETGAKGTGATQLVDVERARQEGVLPEQALEGGGEIGKENLTGQVGKVVCQEVEVEVVKNPQNPRLVRVKYQDEGQEHQILVHVGRNANFKPRMRLKLERPADWASRTKPWEYRGRLPRLPGRW
jgi:hypothetical protein